MGSEVTPQNYIIDLLALAGIAEVEVGETDVAYTKYFSLPRGASFGFLGKIAGSGTVDVKVELEQGNTVPTDQAADSDGMWGVGDEISSGLTATGMHVKEISPVVTKFGRLKLTGQGTNHASTKFTKLEIGISVAK